MSFEHKTFMIIEENNQYNQGGCKLKAVDCCLQYGICSNRKIVSLVAWQSELLVLVD